MGRVIRNAARCLICYVTVESRHRHDLKTCDCGNLTIDGGKSYLRVLVQRPEKMEDLSVHEQDAPTIDGGNDEFTTALFGGVEK